MSTSIPEQIIARIFDEIAGAVVIPVYRGRDASLAENQLPAILVLPLEDIPSEDNGSICWINWSLTVAADIVVGQGLDSSVNTYRAAVFAAVMADRELSPIEGVIDVTPAPVVYKAGERQPQHVAELAFARVPFVIRYRTRHNDLTVGG